MKRPDSFWSAWNERVSALRNVPPVLKIVWQSGPAVVAFGLVCRVVVSLLPLALLAITKLIMDAIVHAVSAHQAVPRHFWWLVAAEFALAVLPAFCSGAVSTMSIAVLADKYTPPRERAGHGARLRLDLPLMRIRSSTTSWSGRGSRRPTASA